MSLIYQNWSDALKLKMPVITEFNVKAGGNLIVIHDTVEYWKNKIGDKYNHQSFFKKIF